MNIVIAESALLRLARCTKGVQMTFWKTGIAFMRKLAPKIRYVGREKRGIGHCPKKYGSIQLKIIRRICDNYLDNFR